MPISKSEFINTKPSLDKGHAAAITTSEVHTKPKLIEIVREKFLKHDEEALKIIRLQLKKTKKRIDQEFHEFSQRLINLVKHAHLLRFSNRTEEDVSGVLAGSETDEHLLQRMADYAVCPDSFL